MCVSVLIIFVVTKELVFSSIKDVSLLVVSYSTKSYSRVKGWG